MNQFPAKNLLLLFLTAVIWGTAFVAQSVGMDHIGPFTFNAIRSLVGGLALIPAILIFGRMKSEERRREERAQRKTLLLGGVFCGLALGIASCLQQVGIQYHGGKGWVYYGTVHRHCSHPGLVLPKEGGSQTVGQCGDRHFGSVSAVYEWLPAAAKGGFPGPFVCILLFGPYHGH